MKTIQEKYNAVLEGSFSKSQFVRDAKRELSQFISPYSQFNDSVQILKSKGILTEAKKEKEVPEYDAPVSKYSDEAVRRGCDYELSKKGIDPVNATQEERDACEKVVIKNLEKDEMHYLNILAGESSKVDKHDKEVEVKKGNEVDVHNGMKKAELKENMYIDHDEFMDEIIKAEMPKVKAALKKADSPYADDDQMVYDFIKTHKDDLPSSYSPNYDQAVVDEFEEFFAANYEYGSDYADLEEKVAKSVEDVIDPADYGMIGQGYLERFNRPHSLDADQLETLGRKVVNSLYKGDFDKAKAKFISPDTEMDEQMSDDEMAAIKDYGKEEKETKVYQLGDKFSSDFDYDGMLKAGLKIKISTPVSKMQQIYDSFEDVNYHSENGHLGNAIEFVEDGDKAGALKHLKLFRDAIRKTLKDINEGHCNSQRKKNEQIMDIDDQAQKMYGMDFDLLNPEEQEMVRLQQDSSMLKESRGAFDMCVSAIQDIAADGDISEREAAMEMMVAIADKYDFDMAGLESQLFHGDDAINEGRRAKSKGGKVVTENDYETGGYVEAMGPMFERAINMLINAWEEWKMGPMTEPGMVEHAKRDIINYIETQLMVENLEEKKGKDHDGDGDIDGDDYMAAKDKAIKKAMGKEEVVKENIKAIISKVLEEGVINEAATNALANFSETYGGFDGMKQAIISLQDLVTDIESYYDKTRTKIQKVYDTLGDIRNEEGLKVGGFLAPAIEQAFNKDLRPAIKGGFTKGLDQPKVKMISQKDIEMHNSGERPLEEKETVYSRPSVNGTLQETKKSKK